MYYSYHNIIKKKIDEGKLIYYEYKQSYNNISPVLILYFSDKSKYPIKEYDWNKYNKYLKILNEKKNKDCNL